MTAEGQEVQIWIDVRTQAEIIPGCGCGAEAEPAPDGAAGLARARLAGRADCPGLSGGRSCRGAFFESTS